MSKGEKEYRWNELAPGCIITNPGNSRSHFTGDWRSFRPELHKERCIRCGLCWISCPDAAYSLGHQDYYDVDLNYCKGCGICASECPAGAIIMAREKED
jgi:pyruvate ferredoxin oxidoreductase delta subunit